MRILFDHNVPAPLPRRLPGHDISTAEQMGWDRLTNGSLLDAAEKAGFDLFLTGDRNMQYQQNLRERMISVIVLSNVTWPVLRDHVQRVVNAVDACSPRSFAEIEIPFPMQSPRS